MRFIPWWYSTMKRVLGRCNQSRCWFDAHERWPWCERHDKAFDAFLRAGMPKDLHLHLGAAPIGAADEIRLMTRDDWP